MKRSIAFIMVLVSMFTLFGCSASPSSTLGTEGGIEAIEGGQALKEFLGNKLIDNPNYNYISAEGIEYYLSWLEKEDTKYDSHVILTVWMEDDQLYKFMELSVQTKKSELRTISDFVIDFAKENNWDNSYYLYIVAGDEIEYRYVYDYEKDTIWIPKLESVFIEMYERFDVASPWDIEKLGTKEAIDFLVNNGFGEIKHNEYESKFYSVGYNVMINDEGEFSTKNNSDLPSGAIEQ